MDWYLAALRKYAEFSGRSRRTEYWMFVLVYVIILVVLALIEGALGMPGVVSGLFQLAMLVPALAVGARRLHDTGRSGWWQLISLIPLIGAVVLIVFFVQDSQPGDNGYGANPKGG